MYKYFKIYINLQILWQHNLHHRTLFARAKQEQNGGMLGNFVATTFDAGAPSAAYRCFQGSMLQALYAPARSVRPAVLFSTTNCDKRISQAILGDQDDAFRPEL